MEIDTAYKVLHWNGFYYFHEEHPEFPDSLVACEEEIFVIEKKPIASSNVIKLLFLYKGFVCSSVNAGSFFDRWTKKVNKESFMKKPINVTTGVYKVRTHLFLRLVGTAHQCPIAPNEIILITHKDKINNISNVYMFSVLYNEKKYEIPCSEAFLAHYVEKLS